MVKISDLRVRDVVNMKDGRKLGYVGDIELDLESGEIKSIIVPRKTGWFFFWPREKEHIIPWCDIVKIGVDIILVELNENEETLHQDRPRRKNNPNLWKKPPYIGPV